MGLGLNRLTVVTGAKHEIGHAMLQDGVRAEIAREIFQGRLTVAASHPYRVRRRASRREPRQLRDIVNSMDRQAGIGRSLHHDLPETQHRWLHPADASRAPLGLQALLVGELQVTAFCRGEGNFVISLSHREPRSPTQLKLRERQIIESLLAGCSQKQMAYDLKLATTTISEAMRQILGKVGVARWEHLVAVGCALGVVDRRQNCILRLDHSHELQLLVRPNVVSRLTPAERDVSLHVIEGWSNAQISRARSTSVRTTANQIASLFRKLNVRGRLELILRLLGDDSAS